MSATNCVRDRSGLADGAMKRVRRGIIRAALWPKREFSRGNIGMLFHKLLSNS